MFICWRSIVEDNTWHVFWWSLPDMLWRLIPSAPGRRVEFVVAVVILLRDLRGGTDHQDTTLQCSRAPAGGQRLRRERERDSALHCQAVSQWVFQPVKGTFNSSISITAVKSVRVKQADFLVPHGSLEATLPMCFGLLSVFQEMLTQINSACFSCSIKFQASDSGHFWLLTHFCLLARRSKHLWNERHDVINWLLNICLRVFFFVQSMAVGVPGLHGRPVRQHAEGGSKVGLVSATALNLSTAAISVMERPTTATAVTKTNVLLVSTSHLCYSFRCSLKPSGSIHYFIVQTEISQHMVDCCEVTYILLAAGLQEGKWADFIYLYI